MISTTPSFHEILSPNTPIRDLGLTIAGTELETILTQFQAELHARGVTRVRPHFYLSTEWGVPFGTVSIAIPFYLARRDLTDLHAQTWGFIEGSSPQDILRYLRHEMGHVVNYAYELYNEEDWIRLFGSITQPYVEDYRPQPFSRRHVRHLPGWYAQKHPDEDWAETFAVWLTPNRDWRAQYEDWPDALAKLEYCNRTLQALRDRPPTVEDQDLDEDVSQLVTSVEQYYRRPTTNQPFPQSFDGALRTIFDEWDEKVSQTDRDGWRSAAELIRSLEPDLIQNIYRWTGHFPEQTQPLLHHLATRAEQLSLGFPARLERSATLALTVLVAALAMNYVLQGGYDS